MKTMGIGALKMSKQQKTISTDQVKLQERNESIPKYLIGQLPIVNNRNAEVIRIIQPNQSLRKT